MVINLSRISQVLLRQSRGGRPKKLGLNIIALGHKACDIEIQSGFFDPLGGNILEGTLPSNYDSPGYTANQRSTVKRHNSTSLVKEEDVSN